MSQTLVRCPIVSGLNVAGPSRSRLRPVLRWLRETGLSTRTVVLKSQGEQRRPR